MRKTRLCSESANLRQGVQPQPKVILDSNPDFRINSESDPDIGRIAPKMLWIHYPIGVSHFTECGENQPVTAVLINLLKSPIPQR